jgi:hypothetical protein
MINNTEHLNELLTPARKIKARVEHFKGSTLYKTYNHFDVLQSIAIDRNGTHKFFGVGICQSVEITILDKTREITVDKGDSFKVYFGVNDSYISNFPLFYVTDDITRDENTNNITIKGWDKLTSAATHKIEELTLEFPITVAGYAEAVASYLGLSVVYPVENERFGLSYAETANYAGTESLRDLLDDIAEITQTIYYIDATGNIVFKQLTRENPFTINKTSYFTLTSKDAVVLGDIGSTTELGDNITAESDIEGITQYIRNNGLLDLRGDRAEILQNAVSAISGLTITPFTCNYRGNYLLEIGDCITLTTKDDDVIYSFLLDEKITYNGGLSAVLAWEFAGDAETNSNPATLGEMLNETFAKVDKAAKEVLIVVSEVDENKQNISSLQMTTSGISADVAKLDAEVNAAVTAEDVRLEIKRELAENGIDKVITTTGFVFDDVGLTVSKSGTEMATIISEDGMTVNKNGQEMLKADNTGVVAKNLHANTYLIVGENSRFENYGSSRTGCFWIGG